MISVAGWEDRLRDPQLVFDIVTKIMACKADPAKCRKIPGPKEKKQNRDRQAENHRRWWAKLRADPARLAARQQKQREARRQKSRSGQRRAA